ncbi:hypothetical protein HYS03_02250 [Candidatus Woesebacteria bacterium]|nr:hypothetical protein [Candidatus Woesebacteria bacterium]QQG47709.1 MAG: hypothetical protein HY044_01305 [Candidatus Woesebacteria bacterium]
MEQAIDQIVAQNDQYKVIVYLTKGDIALRIISIVSNITIEYWYALIPISDAYLKILESIMKKNGTSDLFDEVKCYLVSSHLA